MKRNENSGQMLGKNHIEVSSQADSLQLIGARLLKCSYSGFYMATANGNISPGQLQPINFDHNGCV